jgi:hypothetical protein
MENVKLFIDSLEIGVDKAVKIGLSTRQICKVGINQYEINDFINGWSTATVTADVLEDVLCGKKSLLDLTWK